MSLFRAGLSHMHAASGGKWPIADIATIADASLFRQYPDVIYRQKRTQVGH